MNNIEINLIEAGKKLGLYPKIVTSTKSFDNYNSFFNIFWEAEEPCRRIVVLTPYEELEEIDDRSPGEDIIKYEIIDGNIWIEEYPLTTNPDKIILENIKISKEIVKDLAEKYKKI
ncbi:hypothetical protein ACQPU1_08255 [Clostridium paraputrificum]|uniref:hypothetical protein n=1 Tax=Clostridium TaxID=1485 RepID=UPI003D347578